METNKEIHRKKKTKIKATSKNKKANICICQKKIRVDKQELASYGCRETWKEICVFQL